MTAIILDLDQERALRRRPPEVSSIAPPMRRDLTWKLSKRGNPYTVVDAHHVVVFKRSGGWAFRIEDLGTEQAWFSERRYETEDAGRADALLAVNQLRGREPERLA